MRVCVTVLAALMFGARRAMGNAGLNSEEAMENVEEAVVEDSMDYLTGDIEVWPGIGR